MFTSDPTSDVFENGGSGTSKKNQNRRSDSKMDYQMAEYSKNHNPTKSNANQKNENKGKNKNSNNEKARISINLFLIMFEKLNFKSCLVL